MRFITPKPMQLTLLMIVNRDMTRSLGENTVMTSDSTVHLGITRAGRKEATINVKERVSVARRTSYS